MSNIEDEKHKKYDEKYWTLVPEFVSTSLTYKSTTYQCYYINYDRVGIQYKYPRTDDIVVLLNIDTRELYDMRYQPIIPSHLHDKIWFEISNWMNINETLIGKGMCFIALAFPHDTEITDIFVLIRNFISNEFSNYFVQTNNDQPLTNNATNYSRSMVMDLTTSMIYNVGVNTI